MCLFAVALGCNHVLVQSLYMSIMVDFVVVF